MIEGMIFTAVCFLGIFIYMILSMNNEIEDKRKEIEQLKIKIELMDKASNDWFCIWNDSACFCFLRHRSIV